MRDIYLNTAVVWNAFWSHGHQVATTLAKDRRVLFFENARITGNPHSGLFEKAAKPVPENVEVLRQRRVFAGVTLRYLVLNQAASLRAVWKNRKRFGTYLTYNFVDVAGLLLAKVLGKRTVFLYIDEYDVLTSWPRMKPAFGILLDLHLRWSDVVVCTAKRLCERARTRNANVVYLPNAVDATLVPAAKAANARPVIGYVGSLGSWVDVEAFARLARDFPDCDVEVVGDGARMPELRALKEDGGIANLRIHGHAEREQVAAHLGRFDLAVIPFFRNAVTDSVSPIKLFEYWRFALPVVARRTYELEGFEGSLVLYEDYAGCADAVRRLLANPAEAARLGEAGRKLVETTYNWERYREVFRDSILAS